MSSDNDGRRILEEKVNDYLKDRRQFCRGFVRFTLERGLDTKAPQVEGRKIVETWRQVGRRLYGSELYEATLAAEVAERRQARAEGRLSDVRGHQGKDGQPGQAPRGRKDQRGKDHSLEGRTGTPESSEVEA